MILCHTIQHKNTDINNVLPISIKNLPGFRFITKAKHINHHTHESDAFNQRYLSFTHQYTRTKQPHTFCQNSPKTQCQLPKTSSDVKELVIVLCYSYLLYSTWVRDFVNGLLFKYFWYLATINDYTPILWLINKISLLVTL